MKIGGETGIRTLGTQAHNGFRDRPVRPLRHLSAIDKSGFFDLCTLFFNKTFPKLLLSVVKSALSIPSGAFSCILGKRSETRSIVRLMN